MKLSIDARAACLCVAFSALTLAGCSDKGDDFASEPKPAATADKPARAALDEKSQFAVASDNAQQVLALSETAACSLENVVNMADNSLNPGPVPNSYVVSKATSYKLIGFATNKATGVVPKSIRLMLVGVNVYALDTVTGGSRPDVATYFKVPAFAEAGYQADAAFDDVAPGEYSVFVIEGEGDARVACPTHQTVTVK